MALVLSGSQHGASVGDRGRAALVEAHHGAADLLARAIVRPGDAGVDDVVVAAWASVLETTSRTDDAAAPSPGPVAGSVAVALFGAIVDMLDQEDRLDDGGEEPPAPGPFLPAGDRWAGWWVDDDVSWPVGLHPTREQVIVALRRLPIAYRVLIVGHEAAGLPADEVGPLVGVAGPAVQAHLDAARTAFVDLLADRAKGGPDAG
jgi:DNA-directed RNA polymerase specialized sigma24 family protein